MIEIYTTMRANEINGTCMSASTSREGAMFFFRSGFFFGQHKSVNFFLAQSAYFFSPPPKSEYFSSTLEIRLFFLKKNHTPLPLFEVNWSVPKDKKSEQF